MLCVIYFSHFQQLTLRYDCFKLHFICRWLRFPCIFKTLVEMHPLPHAVVWPSWEIDILHVRDKSSLFHKMICSLRACETNIKVYWVSIVKKIVSNCTQVLIQRLGTTPPPHLPSWRHWNIKKNNVGLVCSLKQLNSMWAAENGLAWRKIPYRVNKNREIH